MPSLLTPLLVGILAVAGVTLLGLGRLGRVPSATRRNLGRLAVLAAGALALQVTFSAAAHPHTKDQATLRPNGPSWDLPASTTPHSILLHGDLPTVERGRAAEVRFTIQVEDRETGEKLMERRGSVEEHWVQGRAGKMPTQSLVTRPDLRLDLPEEARGRPLRVRLTEQKGELRSELRAELIHAPMSGTHLGLGFLAAGLLAVGADAGDPERSMAVLPVAILAGYAWLLPGAATPDGPAGAAFAALALGSMAGVPAAVGLRAAAKVVLPARRA